MEQAQQLYELRRQTVMPGRKQQGQQLKNEVNVLLAPEERPPWCGTPEGVERRKNR